MLDRRDRRHTEAARWDESVDDDLATTPLVLAEVDHLAGTKAGVAARRAFLADVRAGAYLVERWPEAAAESAIVVERFEDLGIT